ncbi:MAG TPA: IclR family transcriptional regulator [Aggregatilineales bacterium]|nr:IclR family transcriptional regulator [Aggregatilineales bacterium]
MPDYTIAVLEDAITLLQILGNEDDGLTLAQLTKESGFVKNKVFRILHTLSKHKLVERSDEGVYRLGVRFLELGQRVKRQSTLLDVSRGPMDWLVQETGESIFLGVIHGSDALCVAARQSPQSIRLYAEVGRRAPLHSGGVPKVLLAFVPDDERALVLDSFPNLTAEARTELEYQLERVRAQDYAVVINELDAGAQSVAAPIRDYRGQVVAALSIAGPSHRFTDAAVQRYVTLVREAADRISAALGYRTASQPVNGARRI